MNIEKARQLLQVAISEGKGLDVIEVKEVLSCLEKKPRLKPGPKPIKEKYISDISKQLSVVNEFQELIDSGLKKDEANQILARKYSKSVDTIRDWRRDYASVAESVKSAKAAIAAVLKILSKKRG